MELDRDELSEIEKYKEAEINKIKSSSLSDEHKEEKLELVESMKFVKVSPTVEVGKCNHNYIQDSSDHYRCVNCGIGFQVR